MPLTRIAAAAAPAMISTAKILRSSRIGVTVTVARGHRQGPRVYRARMARTTRSIGAGIAWLTLVSTICVTQLDAPVAALGATIDCAPATGVAADHAPLASYTPITPVRLIDTRDGTGGVATPIGAGCTMAIDLADSPVPPEAQAVALSVTAIAPQRGFLTVFACEEGRPPTSNLNTRPGVPTPNLVVSAVGMQRRICIFSNEPSDVIVDLAGWWSDGPDRYGSTTPVRAYDTRELPAGERLAAREVRSIPLAGVQLPGDARAAVVNLTVTGADALGFLVAFPCGTEPPLASNLNFLGGEARSVAAIVGLGPAGDMCVMSNVDVHVVVDVTGSYAPAPAFGPAAALDTTVGHRVVDTRTSNGPWTSPLAAGEIRRIDPVTGTPFAGRSAAVVLNVVATNAAEPGWVALFPCGGAVPLVSSLNFAASGETTNLATVEIGPSGEVCVKASQAVDLVIDLFGAMSPPDGSVAERLSFAGRTVFPDFTPAGSDYAIVCDATETALTLHLDLLPGVSARVNGVSHAAGDIDVIAAPEGLTTVDLVRGTTRTTYFFRCVPPDFPALDVERPGTTTPGWNLTTFGFGQVPYGSFTAILDERGAPVWYKRTDVDVIDFKRLADGRLAYTPILGNAFGISTTRGYRLTDLAGRLLAEHLTENPVADPVDHHDYVELSAGRRAMLTYPLVKSQPLAQLGSGYFDGDSIVDSEIHELDASGDTVWTWSALDHFGYDEVTFPVRFGLYPGEPHGGEVDVFHVNSLALVEHGSGDYVVSARHLDAVFRVDRDTGGVLWKLGGAVPGTDPKPQLTIVGDPLGGPLRPHDARLAGNVLTLFDNRAGGPGPARAVAYEIDTTSNTATMLWEIRDPQGRPSNGLGSVRVQTDGSIVVCWGGLQPMFQEFGPDRVSRMTIASDPQHLSYRIVKYPKPTFSAATLRATAGGSAEAPPP